MTDVTEQIIEQD